MIVLIDFYPPFVNTLYVKKYFETSNSLVEISVLNSVLILKGEYLRNGRADRGTFFTDEYSSAASFDIANKKIGGTPPLNVLT